MNILFLVFGFILVFLFFSSTLLKQTLFSSSEQKSSACYFEGKVKIHDKLERYKYQIYDEGVKKGKPSFKKKEGRVKKEESYLSHRMRPFFSAQSKWNLAPLIFTEKQSDYLSDATVSFLEGLYGHTDFWKKGKTEIKDMPKILLDSFKKNREANKICDLFPSDPSLKKIFYKMLKGSGSYDMVLKEGYPPLDDFFRLEKQNTHTLCLRYASFPALKALLGEELAFKILEIEKKKWKEKGGHYAISKQEFLFLANKEGTFIPVQDLDAFIQKDQEKVRLEKITHKEGKRAFLEIPLS